MVLEDLLQDGLNIVFCGTAAGTQSAKRKAYYAGLGNRFYPTLFACKITPRLLNSEEYSLLIEHKIGLTDLAKLAFGMDKALKKNDFDTQQFEEKIKKYNPKCVCFNGKQAAKIYLRKKKTSEITYGFQTETIGKTKLYVAPSTSRAGNKYWDEKKWHDLLRIS